MCVWEGRRLFGAGIGLTLFSLAGLVLLLLTASTLIAAGDHADATAMLTPNNEALWVRSVISFVIVVGTTSVLISARVHSRHPALALLASLCLGLWLSFLAFNVYWWFAAGSYEDMGLKQISHSGWKTYPVRGLAMLGSLVFAALTTLLLAQRRKD